MSIDQDRDEAPRGGTAWADADRDHEYDPRKVSPGTRWAIAGLVVAYAGLGAYTVAVTLGNGSTAAGRSHPEGVTRSVAAAMSRPMAGGGSAAAAAASAGFSGAVAAAKSYAAQAARAQWAEQAPPPPGEVLTAISATAVGPQGASDGDHPQRAAYVIDQRSAMSWVTHWYATAHFGNLKDGTGLLLDMGKAVTIRQVDLALGGSPGVWGADLEIRVGDTPGLDDAAPVATATDVGGWLSKDLQHPVTGRYVQIWFTKLPRDAWGTFQEHVYGVTVHGSPPVPSVPPSPFSPAAHTTSRIVHRGGGHGGGHNGPGWHSGHNGHGGHGGHGRAWSGRH
jgi:hypothetical protein